jgi:hypothetical protein
MTAPPACGARWRKEADEVTDWGPQIQSAAAHPNQDRAGVSCTAPLVS